MKLRHMVKCQRSRSLLDGTVISRPQLSIMDYRFATEGKGLDLEFRDP
ncbi:MAG: hypothetical protein J7647_01265 [Cyanobacteria bacterium SBLK]|nr:hypothetical protein [Cyanobacteria bacterium SBLK]